MHSRYKNNNEAVIGLFGVSKELNGKGIGTKLINNVVSFLTAKGYKKITVVTQGRNLYAQRLYQKAGFLLKVLNYGIINGFKDSFQ